MSVWNQANVTAQFLIQLRSHLNSLDELVVVDDYSTDRTPQVLEWWRSRLEDKMVVLRNARCNLGFGPSINRGVNLTISDIVIIMNNDVRISGPFIEPVVRRLIKQPRSIITAKLVDWDGGWNKFGDLIIPYAEGWFLAMWRKTWDELEGFDERFVPCDYEDQDFSYRAAQHHIELIQLDLPMHHMFGTSANQLEREKITLKNRRRFMGKWGFEFEPKT